jgi:hypothetical protein
MAMTEGERLLFLCNSEHRASAQIWFRAVFATFIQAIRQ